MKDTVEAILGNLRQVIRGKNEVLDLVIVNLLSNGHVLMEDVPGVGKTTLAKALTLSIDGDYSRIQFTPDLLPSDVVGGMVYNPKSGDFLLRKGPVFCNILLADEINRASPRTQSALLEAMSEQQVSIEGNCYPLPQPFMVIATQNPIEYHGTYPLPEAQLDRFAMRIAIGYPEEEEEIRIILDQRKIHPIKNIKPVATIKEIVECQEEVKEIDIEETIVRYITAIVRATRQEPRLKLGGSPRASLSLYRAAQALAYLRSRSYVTPDDIKELAVPVLAHRMVLDTKSSYAGVEKSLIINEILETIKVPV